MLSALPYPTEKKFDINKYLVSEVSIPATQNFKVDVYPNPVNSIVNIQTFFKSKEENVSIFIYDFTGKLVSSKQYKDVHFIKEAINVSKLSSGVYNIFIKTTKSQQSKRFVIAK